MCEVNQCSLDSALELLAQGPISILAGGTDFYPALGEQAVPERVLDVTSIAGLRCIDATETGWSIGAACTWTDLVNTPLPPLFDGLKSAALEIGSVQIQNAATIVGNVCNASPAADGVPALLTLNASIEVASVRGHRVVSLAQFIQGPRKTLLESDELVVAIHVPSHESGSRSVFYKLGARRYLVISITMVSITLIADDLDQLTDVRIAVGACSAVACRLPELEKVLIGQSIHADIIACVTAEMFSALTPIDDVRSSGHYRMNAAQQIVKRQLLHCVTLLPGYAREEQGEDVWQTDTNLPIGVAESVNLVEMAPAAKNPSELLEFDLNGEKVSPSGLGTQRLSSVLRDQLSCKDVKLGCNAGDCGACTVLINGNAVCACLTPIIQVKGCEVTTLAGLAGVDPLMRQLQSSFLAHGASQCGICTPGMLTSALALLRREPKPDEATVRDALGGVLCRCTGYRMIIKAVMNASQQSLDADSATEQNSVQVVGMPVPRIDGQEKVDGTDAFGDDVAPDDASIVRLIRSPYHSANFKIGDLEAYICEHAGIECVLTAVDIPGSNAFGVIPPFIDQPVFAETFVRFRGEAIAAIVGDPTLVKDLNLADFPVSWQEQEAVLDPVAAMREGAEQLHEHANNNVLCTGLVKIGDAEEGLESAFVRVAGEFSTGFVEHAYIEPEAGYAVPVGDTVEIHGCTQAPYLNRDALSVVLGLDKEQVRIIPTSVGGGFGSKLDLSYQPYVALAAMRLGRPVRMAYTRQESLQSSTKRHPSKTSVDIGVDAQGKICGYHFEGVFNTGAYASWGPTVADRVPIHASGPYYTPNYLAETTGVYTHSAPAGAFRGFGVPQAAIAQESLYDELAERLDMDRLAFRVLNALDNDQPTVTGQRFASSVGIKACFQALQQAWHNALRDVRDFNHEAANSGSVLRRGVGVAGGWYGCGNTSMSNPSTIKAGIAADGTVYLHQGAVDIGQGSNTVVAQIFAESLGVPLSSIVLKGADSGITPDAGKTSASRQTFVSGNAARLSALAMRDTIARLTNCRELNTLQIDADRLTVNGGGPDETTVQLSQLPRLDSDYVIVGEESYDPPTRPRDANGQGEPYALYGYAAQMVVLDVDTRLGTVKLQRLTAAHDVGKAINPLLVEGQIHGGVAQGIGLALMEEFIPGRTENLHDYLIPTVGDVPPIDTVVVEVADPHGPFGAKGLGEHVLIPTAPAILNAIADACGARIHSVPATPDKVLAAIDALPESI